MTELAPVMAQASAMWAQGRHAEAIGIFRALRERHPADTQIALRLGIALVLVDRLDEAIGVLEPLSVAAGDADDVHDWLGRALAALHWHQRGPDAIAALRAAVARQPDDPLRHMQLAHALLSCGHLAEAWPHYAWRWLEPPAGHHVRGGALLRPDPGSWRGQRVLLFPEQGLGDMLQFMRYVPVVMEHGAHVTVEVFPALRRLAATLPGSPDVVTIGEAVPPHDIAIPLMNLPWAFGTDVSTIPGGIPYFTPDPQAVAAWRDRLAALPGLKVGLVWAGEPRQFDPSAYRIDRRRSLKLAALAPLARVPGVSFVSLQKGAGAPQAAHPPPGMVLHDWTAELADYADTAALVQALDLVISADTSPVHMAGALGRPVWLLSRYDSCYRWLRDRDDSPWYPSLRQFRQAVPGDWTSVIDRAAAALMERVA